MNAREEMACRETLGIIADLDIEGYHAGPGISKSGLDLIARAPAHYYAWKLAPNRPPEPDRAGQLEGTLAHCAILEPAEFARRYVTVPADAPRRPTEVQWNAKNPSDESRSAMDWWRQWMADNCGRTVITAAQYDIAMRQAEAVRKLPDIAEALDAGAPEQSAYWLDPETGVLCRCRPDWRHPAGDAGSVLLDVKTYSDASPDEFARQVARKRYHVQDAFYSEGWQAAGGGEVLAFIFVAVESAYPFHASATILDDQARERGRDLYRRDVATYAQCIQAGKWPGYSTGIETISLPAWAL